MDVPSSADGAQTKAPVPADLQAQLALLQQQDQYLQQLPNSEQVMAFYSTSAMMMQSSYKQPDNVMNPRATDLAASKAGDAVDVTLGEVEEEETKEAVKQELVFVNPKQFYRILRRRTQRAKLEAKQGSVQRYKAFQYVTRHKHALRRPRVPDGRFLTKEEIEGLKNGSIAFEDLPKKKAAPTSKA